MIKRRYGLVLTLVLVVGMILGACGTSTENVTTESNEQKKDNFTVAMVTDIGGVDDKSFNQSAWEGIQSFGKESGLEKGKNGYNYLQSKSDADYTTNLNTLVREDYSLIYAIGFSLAESVTDVATQRPKAKFAIVDEVVEKDNVASVTFLFVLALVFSSPFRAGVVHAVPPDPCVKCQQKVQHDFERCEARFGVSRFLQDQFNQGIIDCYATVCEQSYRSPG